MKHTFRKEYIEKLDGDGVIYGRDALAMLLSNAFHGEDMSEVADNLLERFPSVRAVFRASVDELMAVKGVNGRIAAYLKAVDGIEKFSSEHVISEIKGSADFAAKVKKRLLRYDTECAEFFLVSSRGRVIADEVFTSDSINCVRIQTKEVIKFLTRNKAYGLYCAHNHVEGTCAPSFTDDEITRKIAALCDMCSVKFIDHVIIDAHGDVFSYGSTQRLGEIAYFKP